MKTKLDIYQAAQLAYIEASRVLEESRTLMQAAYEALAGLKVCVKCRTPLEAPELAVWESERCAACGDPT